MIDVDVNALSTIGRKENRHNFHTISEDFFQLEIENGLLDYQNFRASLSEDPTMAPLEKPSRQCEWVSAEFFIMCMKHFQKELKTCKGQKFYLEQKLWERGFKAMTIFLDESH